MIAIKRQILRAQGRMRRHPLFAPPDTKLVIKRAVRVRYGRPLRSWHSTIVGDESKKSTPGAGWKSRRNTTGKQARRITIALRSMERERAAAHKAGGAN